jgi:hypothetical protein
MLSPHEFAALMLVKDAEQISNVDASDLRILLERNLVECDIGACASMQPRVTERGHALLARLHVTR